LYFHYLSVSLFYVFICFSLIKVFAFEKNITKQIHKNKIKKIHPFN
jgi:hypothetical protein